MRSPNLLRLSANPSPRLAQIDQHQYPILPRAQSCKLLCLREIPMFSSRKLPALRRYAVAVFSSATELLEAIEALAVTTPPIDNPNLLGLRDVVGARELAVNVRASEREMREHQTINLSVGGNDQPAVCSAGDLADALEECAQSGAETLEKAFENWMVPSQAKRLADDVKARLPLLWVRIKAVEEEMSVCEALLRAAPMRVEVHDLVPVGHS